MSDIKDKALGDKELEQVNGGTETIVKTRLSKCPGCDKETLFMLYTGGRAICKDCGYEKLL